MTEKLDKCKNPACSCSIGKGEKYCSAHCEGLQDKTEIVCQCGHPGCQGDAINANRQSASYSV